MVALRFRRSWVAALVAALLLALPVQVVQGAAMAVDMAAAGCADCDAGPDGGACAVACTAIPAIGDAAVALQRIGSASFEAPIGADESGLAPGPDPSPPRNPRSS